MPDFEDIIAFENGELDNDEIICMIQNGLNEGWVWELQGSYGRIAEHLINAGLCNVLEVAVCQKF